MTFDHFPVNAVRSFGLQDDLKVLNGWWCVLTPGDLKTRPDVCTAHNQ